MMSAALRTMMLAWAASILAGPLPGQLLQLLPHDTSGFLLGGLLEPFSRHGITIQYHYDSAEFQAQAPIIITDVFFRGFFRSTPSIVYAPIGPYDIPAVEVVIASSPTDYSVGGNGVQPGHDPVFANNLNPDAMVMRSGRYRGSGQTAPAWEPIGSRVAFPYDPSQGLDLVIQVRTCAVGVQWDTGIEAAASTLGVLGPLGGNFYVNYLSCAETSESFRANQAVPRCALEYHLASSFFADFFMEGFEAVAPVVFDDRSHSPDPAGIVSWLWTFGDGTMSTLENPTHSYGCQGTYTVSLLVTDGANNVAQKQRQITLAAERFDLATAGGGVGDLNVTPPRSRCFPVATRGYSFISLDAFPGAFGQGPFLGLVPDMWTWFSVLQPAAVGNPFHFLTTPGVYPDVPLNVPNGYFSCLTGRPMDAVIVYVDAQGIPIHVSNVDQVVF